MAHRRKFVLSVPFPSEKRPFCGSFSATLCPILSPGSTLARGTEWALIEMYVFTSLDSLDPQENPLHSGHGSQVLFLVVPSPISQAQDALHFLPPFKVSVATRLALDNGG